MKRTLMIALAGVALMIGAAACEPAANSGGGGSVEDAVQTHFGDVYDKAMRVVDCESGGNPTAVSSGGGNHGLFQVNNVHRGRVESMGYSWSDIYDPYVNSEVARSIYNESGWSPWPVCGSR